MERNKNQILLFLLGYILAMSGCDQRAKAPPAATPQPAPDTRLPSVTEVFHLQSECAELGKKLLEDDLNYQLWERFWKDGKKKPPVDFPSQRSHYNPKTNRCYVEITTQTTDTTMPVEHIWTYLYDGQTGEVLAFTKFTNGKLSAAVLSPTAPVYEYDEAASYIHKMMEDTRQ